MTTQEYNKVANLSIAHPVPVELIPLVLEYARKVNNAHVNTLVAKWIQATVQVAATSTHRAA